MTTQRLDSAKLIVTQEAYCSNVIAVVQLGNCYCDLQVSAPDKNTEPEGNANL